MGVSLSQATYYLAVLNAPTDLQEMIKSGKIRSLDKAAVIAGIDSSEIRKEAIQACVGGSTLKEIRKIIVDITLQVAQLRAQHYILHACLR